MSLTWRGAPELKVRRTRWGKVRLWLRFPVFAVSFLVLQLIYFAASPLLGRRRAKTLVTARMSRIALRCAGLRLRVRGRWISEGALMVNHAGWLDIFTMSAAAPVSFVSKAEVRGWPVAGLIAQWQDTVFIERRRGETRAQTDILEARLRAGHLLCLFPEGTSTDSRRVLDFRSALFAAPMAAGLPVQPVTVVYRARDGLDPRLYGWWGEMAFQAHIFDVFAESTGGTVEVIFHPPLDPQAYPDRKALAAAATGIVRRAHAEALGGAADGGIEPPSAARGGAAPP